MGFFDRFKRKKEEVRSTYDLTPDLMLQYSSGIRADIKFGNVEDLGPNFNNKLAQKVDIVYCNSDNNFVSKSFYMEPIYYQDENGNQVCYTKEYYQGLSANGNNGVVKGFFKKEELDNIERRDGSNYIGGLAVDAQGNFMRNYDENFKYIYGEYSRAVKARETEERNNLKRYERSENEKFKMDLLKQVENGHSGYQNMCDNEDSRHKAMQKLNRDQGAR